jgi:hypothetical protein
LTGIALSTNEGTNLLFLADLNQAIFTPGSPAGTWTAGTGEGFQSFPEFSGFSAGTSGMAVAPGSHLAIVAGEFGGNQFGVVQLPSLPGGSPPMAINWVAATMPSDPDGNAFSMGCDPHTLTAYKSPNFPFHAIGLMTTYGPAGCGGKPVWIGVIDLDALLVAPQSVPHVADSPLPAGVVTFVKAQFP